MNRLSAILVVLLLVPLVSSYGSGRTHPAPKGLQPVVEEGRPYLGLKQVATHCGMAYKGRWKGPIQLQNQVASLSFEPEQRRAEINGTTVWLHLPVRKTRAGWSILEADYRLLIDPVLNPSRHLQGRRCEVIVLDPGHGGKDSGTTGSTGSMEKKLVLDLSERLARHLRQDGLKVHLTRSDDRFIDLEQRPAQAGRLKADLFISLHLNSADSKLARGAETYVLPAAGRPSTSSRASAGASSVALPGNGHDAASNLLGYYLHRALLDKSKAVDRGVKRARFAVLRTATCPAALVECGFLSHAAEEQLLLSETYREKLALGLYKGILDYRAAITRGHLARGAKIGLDPVGLNRYVRYAGPTPIPGIKENASGMAFRPDTHTLLVVCNKPEMISEIDLSGRLVRTIKLSGFEDTEAITYLGEGMAAVLEERRRTLCLIELGEKVTNIRYEEAVVLPVEPGKGDNNGLEALAFDPVAEVLLMLKERKPQRAYRAGFREDGQPVIEPIWNLEANPLPVLDLSGACREEQSSSWLVLSDETRRILQVDDQGRVNAELSLAPGQAGLDKEIPQPEGLALDGRGRLFLCSEPNLLFVFGPPRPAVPAAPQASVSSRQP